MNDSRSLQAEPRTRPVATRQTPSPPARIIRTAHVLPVDADLGRVGNAFAARIAAAKKRLLAGGVLQPVEWGIPGEPDERGRKRFTYYMIHVMIEQGPGLDRGRLSTERSDDTILTILDQLSILTEHIFRFGDPPHTYSIKAVDGIVLDEETGVRYASEVVLIR